MRRIARSELKPATPLTADALLRQAARDAGLAEKKTLKPRIYTADGPLARPCLSCDGVIRQGDRYCWQWIRGDWKPVHTFCL